MNKERITNKSIKELYKKAQANPNTTYYRRELNKGSLGKGLKNGFTVNINNKALQTIMK